MPARFFRLRPDVVDYEEEVEERPKEDRKVFEPPLSHKNQTSLILYLIKMKYWPVSIELKS